MLTQIPGIRFRLGAGGLFSRIDHWPGLVSAARQSAY